MAIDARAWVMSGSARGSSVLVAAVLGAAAGGLGFPVTAALQFDREPSLFLIGIALAIGLAILARRLRGRDAVLILAGLIWVLVWSGLILALVKPDRELTSRLFAVTSNAAPFASRLTSAGWLALISSVIAAASVVVAGLVASWRRA